MDGPAVTIVGNVASTVPDPCATWVPLPPENIRNPLARAVGASFVEETLTADLVVVATGLTPASTLYRECGQRHVAPELHDIGDSFAVGRVFDAVKAGSTLGRSLWRSGRRRRPDRHRNQTKDATATMPASSQRSRS
jgi:2-enoate reductase